MVVVERLETGDLNWSNTAIATLLHQPQCPVCRHILLGPNTGQSSGINHRNNQLQYQPLVTGQPLCGPREEKITEPNCEISNK